MARVFVQQLQHTLKPSLLEPSSNKLCASASTSCTSVIVLLGIPFMQCANQLCTCNKRLCCGCPTCVAQVASATEEKDRQIELAKQQGTYQLARKAEEAQALRQQVEELRQAVEQQVHSLKVRVLVIPWWHNLQHACISLSVHTRYMRVSHQRKESFPQLQ